MEIFVRLICGFLAIFTLFLLTLSLIFSFGGDAPNMFGKNVYIVKTDALEILNLNPGTALLTSVVPPEEINPGDIVVFKNSDNRAGIAEIDAVRLSENVYGFDAVSERGADMVLTQSQIIGKAMYYSDFLGKLIGFVKSPAGALVIAVIPCMIILIHEVSKSIMNAARRKDERMITPVKKQDEIPTYVPRQKVAAMSAAAKNAYSKTSTSELGDIELDDKEEDESVYPLFLQPKPKASPPKPKIQPSRPAPLSQKRLNEAIAAVKSRSNLNSGTTRPLDGYAVMDRTEELMPKPSKSYMEELEGSATSEIKRLLAVDETEGIKPVSKREPPVLVKEESIRKYTPKKVSAPVKNSQTSAIPSLDKLLKDDETENESENSPYNIEDILFAIDRKK